MINMSNILNLFIEILTSITITVNNIKNHILINKSTKSSKNLTHMTYLILRKMILEEMNNSTSSSNSITSMKLINNNNIIIIQIKKIIRKDNFIQAIMNQHIPLTFLKKCIII